VFPFADDLVLRLQRVLEREVKVDVTSTLGGVLVDDVLLFCPDWTGDLPTPHQCCVILRDLKKKNKQIASFKLCLQS
jgi:hypothetical protein